MNDTTRTLCLIMGGGRGTRMYPLTLYRSKPAVPLGGRYRLIDIPISNCINSGFNKILVLTQYNSESLNKHIFRTYKLDSFSRGFVEILAAEQSYERTEWFQGTADSVRRSLPHIRNPLLNEVIVLSGDQLYTMDLQDFQRVHRETNADITIACHPEHVSRIKHFGIMAVNKDNVITEFCEKPQKPELVKSAPVMINQEPHYLANMGIYIFKKNILEKLLTEINKDDFGKEIIPEAIKKYKVVAYHYSGYWSDIGTIASYYEDSLMLTDPLPPFNLYDEDWQIYTRARYLAPAKISNCSIKQSIIAEGCIIEAREVRHSIVGVRSVVGKNTLIEDSILTGNDYYENTSVANPRKSPKDPRLGIGQNCLIRKAIIDKNCSIGNHVQIANKDNVESLDGPNYSIRDRIVVIHKGAVIKDNTII